MANKEIIVVLKCMELLGDLVQKDVEQKLNRVAFIYLLLSDWMRLWNITYIESTLDTNFVRKCSNQRKKIALLRAYNIYIFA